MGRKIVDKSRNNCPDESYDDSVQQPQMMSLDSRVVMLHGDVTERMISMVVLQLFELSRINQNPIRLVVSTNGGSVDEMFNLYDVIKFLPSPVYTVGFGKILSAGVLILASGKKGERLIGRTARVMIHPLSAGAIGNVFELVNTAEEIRRRQELAEQALASETKMSLKAVKEIMRCGVDRYFSAEEAIKLGIVDRIVG
jgi:ATP-dependent Clp protease protease subunit